MKIFTVIKTEICFFIQVDGERDSLEDLLLLIFSWEFYFTEIFTSMKSSL